MLYCGGSHYPIHYISDYKMTVLYRHVLNEAGQTIVETYWANTKMFAPGPVVFTNALDAEIIRQIENKNLKPNEIKWQCCDLFELNLPEMMKMLGGQLTLHIFNGYVATRSRNLVNSDSGALRMNLLPVTFSNESLAENDPHVSFEFDPSIFTSLRETWEKIASPRYVAAVESINQDNPDRVDSMAQHAKAAAEQLSMQLQLGTIAEQMALYDFTEHTWKFSQ